MHLSPNYAVLNLPFFYFAPGGEFIKDFKSKHESLFEEHCQDSKGNRIKQRVFFLAIFIDSFNPFNSGQHSLLPFIIVLLNLDPAVRTKFENMLLHLLISGPTKPTNVQTYLEILVKELQELLEDGVEVWDAYKKETVNIKVVLLLCIHDSRGWRSIALQEDPGCFRACKWCDITGKYLNNSSKYVYMHHRRTLPKEHPLRRDPRWAEEEFREILLNTHETLMGGLDALENGLGREFMCGMEGRSVLLKLPYWNLVTSHAIEPMHSIPNVGRLVENDHSLKFIEK